jgi:hypothetical protein
MAEAATALLALWNDVDPERDAAYNEWHAREHVPERLTVPGMLWGLRLRRIGAGAMPLYLTLYGLRDEAVLDSEPYLNLLRHPTPASRDMRPALSHIARWVCRLRELVDIDRGERLAVRTFETRAAATGPALEAFVARPHRGRLVAERSPEARALPWLTQGQSFDIEGDLLACLATEGESQGRVDRTATEVSYQRM